MNSRRLAIMRLIDARRKFTARELAERFGVSIRTIQRDLDELQRIGFPLYSEAGARGGYRALPNRLLPPLQLNMNEALGLFLMLEQLERTPDFPYGAARAHLAEEYYGSLPPDARDRIDRLRAHLAFRTRGAPPGKPGREAARDESATTAILEAAADKRAIAFDYRSASGMKRVEAAFPIGLYLENGFWYMPAMKNGRALLYRVDRMRHVAPLDLVDASVPALREWLEAEETRNGVEVVLRYTEAGARLAETDPLLGPARGGQWRGIVPREELPFTARRLLAYGPEVEAVEPAELRALVTGMLERALERYGQTSSRRSTDDNANEG